MRRDAYIAGYARSPFTFARKGGLARTRPDELGAAVVRALLERAGVDGAAIEDVVWGCAFPEGEQGINLGRVVGLQAGLPQTCGGVTVNRWCGSAIQAVQMAAGMIAMNAGDAFVAGGTECMSRVPMMGFNLAPNPAWTPQQVADYCNVGLTAERVADRYSLSREEQDRYGLHSQKKAWAAQQEGRFDEEIVAIQTTQGAVDRDGCVRDTSLEQLARLKPAFKQDGSVTAGTSSPMTDGAAALLVCSEDFLVRNGLTPYARVASFAVSGCEPGLMGLGPIESTRKALARAGVGMDRVGVVEMNEAFASQAEACRRDLRIDPEILNRDGGAIALGHPLGATGARLVGKAAQLLRRHRERYAVATQCIGGGMGTAMVLEAI